MKFSKIRKALSVVHDVDDLISTLQFELDSATDKEARSKLEQIMEAIEKVHRANQEYQADYEYFLPGYAGEQQKQVDRIQLAEAINQLVLLLPVWRLSGHEREHLEASVGYNTQKIPGQ